MDEEEIALSRREGRRNVWGDRVALQETQNVLFGRAAPEGLRYVPIDEQGLWNRERNQEMVR